jgi:DNA-binding PadR family transcriptional regulator
MSSDDISVSDTLDFAMGNEFNLHDDLPLTEATFLILLSLLPEPKHGYRIMRDVQSLSEGRVSLSTGTLYGALKRLLEQGWVARVDGQPTGDRRRKAYVLTRLGRRVLDAEVTRLQTLVSTAQVRTSEVEA